MPIKVSRSTGKIISGPEWTQEQRDLLWGEIVKAYAKKHPEIFTEGEGNTYENKL